MQTNAPFPNETTIQNYQGVSYIANTNDDDELIYSQPINEVCWNLDLSVFITNIMYCFWRNAVSSHLVNMLYQSLSEVFQPHKYGACHPSS